MHAFAAACYVVAMSCRLSGIAFLLLVDPLPAAFPFYSSSSHDGDDDGGKEDDDDDEGPFDSRSPSFI